MSFRSKASKINAENYVEIKQEASANLPKTTNLSANNPNFGPFKPKNTSVMPLNPTNIRPDEVVEKSHKENKDSKENGVNGKENEKKVVKRRKKVWKPGGKIQWTENIDVDLNEVVQVEDVKENESPKIGIMEGTIVAKHVWCLPPGRRIIVHFNEYDQPVRKGGLVLIHFLSDLSRDGSFCPIGAQTWRHVDNHYKEKIIKTAYDKFVLPDRREIRRMLLSHVNIKWKHYKWDLQKKYFNPKITKEKMIEQRPEDVTQEQWINLVSYWCSEQFKKLSTLEKRARATQHQRHTTGSRSYAQDRIDFFEIHGREPTALEWWEWTHARDNGGYVDGTCTQEFMDIAHARVEERLCTSENTREVIEKEVFDELMYQADKSNQRVVGYGHGVNRSHVFDLEAQFRKSKLVNGSDTSSEVMNIKSYLVSVEKKNDEVISQLQKQNEELEKQNADLKVQNKQVLAQLDRVSSILEKLEKNQWISKN